MIIDIQEIDTYTNTYTYFPHTNCKSGLNLSMTPHIIRDIQEIDTNCKFVNTVISF